ncbi:MAG: hypothetical protein V1932_01960 [Chloroflexota bacterium]
MINPAYAGLMLVVFVSLGLVLFRRVKSRAVRPGEMVIALLASMGEYYQPTSVGS